MARRWVGVAVVAVAVLGACGGGGESGTTVRVTLTEFRIVTDAASAPAGRVTFRAVNRGQQNHELVVLRTDLAPDALPVTGAKVDEDAAGIDAVGEIEEFGPGKTEKASFELRPGAYVLICNIEGHYQQGMHAGFTVR
jgi:uncharacterized cupredoxin-like copper-binding protein